MSDLWLRRLTALLLVMLAAIVWLAYEMHQTERALAAVRWQIPSADDIAVAMQRQSDAPHYQPFVARAIAPAASTPAEVQATLDNIMVKSLKQ